MPRKVPPRSPGSRSPTEPILPGVNPAAAVHDTPETGLPFPIVAVGASAGGLQAMTELLKALPSDTGMAFVMIQHLSPTHPSMLSDILTRTTEMPVRQVENNVGVEPNHIYVIPPAKSMVLAEGRLQLSPRSEVRGLALPVDHFMRSLAEEHGHKAVGIVLSGTGNDGTLGLEEIRAAGGITFAQDNTAEHTGMPRSAIAAGAVEHVLPAPGIARELARIAKHPYLGATLDHGRTALTDIDLQRILEALRLQSGVDFADYKRNTLHRRIVRRMLLHRIDNPRDYVKYVQAHPAELDALYQDVLINVTSFFRNPEAYEALKTHVFPKLTEGRGRHEQVRIWALGCSTGEEAYSLAMAFSEYLEASQRRVGLQVFATDLNGAGLEKARSGSYGPGIAQDVSPERLRRFFVEVDGSYRICKPIRDMCVFARQNVLADPPFSRIDLVACRNLLIYLEPVLQQRLIPLLHYALRGDGFLWLGSSETIGSYRDLFEIIDQKNKIYEKKHGVRGMMALPAYAGTLGSPRTIPAAAPAEAPGPESQKEADRLLLSRYSPPGVLLNADLEIVQFRGDTSPYLSPAPGKASLNLLKMLREGLMVAVRGAIQRARRDAVPTREENLRVRAEGSWRTIDVVVLPLTRSAPPGSMLVLFEESAQSIEARARQLDAEVRAALADASPDADGAAKEVARLKQELAATRDYLESVIEQQEAANEELQSANEEVQSANEELQSVNEELETSKEEIQSSNEELATVNDELQNRNLEIAQGNNDLSNLLSSVQMAIVMLGPDLRIRRFTPMAEKVLNLIPADVGRPLADLKITLSVDDLEDMMKEAMDSMSIREREVQDRDGHWYALRVRPYRTLENKIDGAVLILVDINDLKLTQGLARDIGMRVELLADSAPILLWTTDGDTLHFVNRAFQDFVGATESDIRASPLTRFMHAQDRTDYQKGFKEALHERGMFEGRFRLRHADGSYRWMKARAVPRMDAEGRFAGYVGSALEEPAG